MFRATILTLYPSMFPGFLGESLSGRALESGLWSIETKNIRDHGIGVHRAVDDTPTGGGAGMVLRPDVLANAFDSVVDAQDNRPRFLLSPRGEPLRQRDVRKLATGPGVILTCGRFEGVDQRFIDARDLKEVSIGDYILSGGEPAAMILLDACVRLLPGVMGNAVSGMKESFEENLLEHSHYTKPTEWEGRKVPDILLSGHHKKIEAFRRQQAEALTKERRPDLLKGR